MSKYFLVKLELFKLLKRIHLSFFIFKFKLPNLSNIYLNLVIKLETKSSSAV